jgi:hypothetical protein
MAVMVMVMVVVVLVVVILISRHMPWLVACACVSARCLPSRSVFLVASAHCRTIPYHLTTPYSHGQQLYA